MEYDDFELLITPDQHIRCHSDAGEEAGQLRLDMNNIRLALELIELGQTNADFLKSLGCELCQALFPPTISRSFSAARASAAAKNCGLRLRLEIEAPEVSALPWELLYDESAGAYLANDLQTPVSRYIDVPQARRDLNQAGLPLKILIVIASPADLPSLDAAGEERLIRAALQPQAEAGRVELDVLADGTVRNILQKLREKPHNVLHFVGHGAFDGARGLVALVGEHGETQLLDEERFAALFLGNSSLALAVLNACRGAAPSSHKILAGVAPRLVQRGVPAVIAMRYPVQDATVRLFADEFYRSLALGWPVDAAVQTTRNAISIQMGLDTVDFATPVLYMRAKDGAILDGLGQGP